MGMNSVLLKDLPADETKVITLDLLKTMDPNDVQNEKSRGQLTLELTYKPFKEEDMEKEGIEGTDVVQKAPDGTPAGGGLLYVIVHEAQDLEGKHHTNPYAKIIFKGEEKKTKVLWIQIMPFFLYNFMEWLCLTDLFIYTPVLGHQEE